MSKGLIDIIDEYREYFYKEFPTPEHKAVYRNLRKSYLLAMWLNLTVGFSGVHCLYLNSYMFFVYLLLLIIFFPPDEYTPIMLLNISAFEMFRIPFAVFLYNLRLKKSIIENDIQKMLLVDYSNDVIFFLISVVILTAILNFYPINVFVFWHYLLNLPYIY